MELGSSYSKGNVRKEKCLQELGEGKRERERKQGKWLFDWGAGLSVGPAERGKGEFSQPREGIGVSLFGREAQAA